MSWSPTTTPAHNQLEIEVLGPEGIKAAARAQRAAFPDQETIIDEMIVEGDLVAVRARDRGTHTGAPFAGIEPRGNRFEITWIDIFRVRDGKLREAWLEINVATFRNSSPGSRRRGRVADSPPGDYRAGSVDPLLAAQALALLALVLATYRYARLVRRRALARRQLREREETGLRGLVRVLGADQERKSLRQPEQREQGQ